MNQDRSTTITNSQLKEGYKQTEIGIIPEDWECVDLDRLNPFITSGSRGWANFYSEYGDPFVRITNMFRESISLDLHDLRYVNLPIGASEGKRTQLYDGDLLISITADIGIISYVDKRLQKPAYINQHIALVRFDKEKVSSQFISYFLSHESSQKWFRGGTDQGAKAGMSLITVRKIKAAIPPLLEQEAIACTLSDIDALIESLDRLLTKKRQIKQGAMQELLRSKEGWNIQTIEDIGQVDPENLDSKTSPNYEFKYISLEQVDRGFLNGWTEQIFSASPSRARRKVKKDDILISTVRPNLQSHYLIQEEVYNFVCSTGFAVIRCKEEIAAPYYVFSHFFGSFIERQIEALITGSNYPAINSSDVKKLKIPMPPSLSKQIEIANILSDMDAEIDSISAKLTKTRQLKQGMMQELLTGRIRLVDL